MGCPVCAQIHGVQGVMYTAELWQSYRTKTNKQTNKQKETTPSNISLDHKGFSNIPLNLVEDRISAGQLLQM